MGTGQVRIAGKRLIRRPERERKVVHGGHIDPHGQLHVGLGQRRVSRREFRVRLRSIA